MNERHVQLLILLVTGAALTSSAFLTNLSFRVEGSPDLPAGVCHQDGTIASRRVRNPSRA